MFSQDGSIDSLGSINAHQRVHSANTYYKRPGPRGAWQMPGLQAARYRWIRFETPSYAVAQGQLQCRNSRTGYRKIRASQGNVAEVPMENHTCVQRHMEPIGCDELFEFVRNINGYGTSSVLRVRLIQLPSPSISGI